jgi:hypothetical protein
VARYQDNKYLTHQSSDAFDKEHRPSDSAPFAGIYRCMGCGREIGIAYNHVLPPQNHHEHTPQQGAIRWRLIVFADHDPK